MKYKDLQNIQITSYKDSLFHKHNLKLQIIRLIFSIVVITTLCFQNSFAYDYTRWDLPNGAKLRLGKGKVENISYSPDGNRLIVESSIGIWFYDVHTGSELDFIAENSLDFLGISPDTSLYVSMDTDNTVQVRDRTDSSVIVTLKGETESIKRIAFSPDGSTLAAGDDDLVQLWDTTTGDHLFTLTGHTRSISSLAFSPDSTKLVSGSWDKTIRVWDVESGKHQTTFDANLEDPKPTGGISALVFSSDGRTVASGTYNTGKVQLWDVVTEKYEGALNAPISTIIALNPNGTILAVGRGTELFLWDVPNNKLKFELTGHRSSVSSLAFSPDGKTFVSGGDAELLLWEVATGEQTMLIDGHTKSLYGLAISPDNRTLATGNRENIGLWNVNTGEEIGTLYDDWRSSSSLAFSPDGSTLASGMGWRLRLWNIPDGTPIAMLKGYRGNRASGTGISSIAYSPDGKYLASANSNDSIRLWYAGRTYRGDLLGHMGDITEITFSYDSLTLATASKDRTVRLWDVESGTVKTTFTGHSVDVYSVSFSPDASMIASGDAGGTVIVWDVINMAQTVIHTGHDAGVISIVFSGDGKTIATSAEYGSNPYILLWDVATGEHKGTLIGHSGTITNLITSRDGNSFISASTDGTVLVWDITSIIDTDTPTTHIAEDVNRDGVVDLQDLVYVATKIGETGTGNSADVNNDGVVDITDIILVAAALSNENGIPSKLPQSVEQLSAIQVQQWIMQARQVNIKTPNFQRGISNLTNLLTQLTPQKTVLLPNYPNPFNPETWIPYQLAEPTEVTIKIYSSNGQLIRNLYLGKKAAGIYQEPNRAAYWNGKNEHNEPVASGVYFYTLSAGQDIATRRMVIRK